VICTVNSNYRIAATLYSLETWSVSGISAYILHKGDDDDDDDDDDWLETVILTRPWGTRCDYTACLCSTSSVRDECRDGSPEVQFENPPAQPKCICCEERVIESKELQEMATLGFK
jgi:hypothetical protein